MLIGRTAETDAIRRLVEAARSGRGGALAVRGEAGVGKTALLGSAVAAAQDMTILRARGSPLEARLAFSCLADLVRPLAGRLGRLPAAHAAVLRPALTLEPGASSDAAAVGAALVRLLAGEARDRPVLVVVDDAHWADPATTRALVLAARRLAGERVALLVGLLEPAPDSPFAALDGLTVAPLGGDDAAALLDRLLPRSSPPELRRYVVAGSGGNPLALTEIPGLLSAAGLLAGACLNQPLPLGERLMRAYGRPLAGLPAGGLDVLVVAAASPDGDLGEVSRAAAALGLEPADLGPPADAGLVTLTGGKAVFAGPLLRSAVYHQAAPPARRAAHRALAGAASGERRAWHLAAAASGTDDNAADALASVAAVVSERSPAAAALARARSAELTPPGRERARRSVAAAEAALLAGRATDSLALLDGVEPDEDDPSIDLVASRCRGSLALLGVPRLTGTPQDLVEAASRVGAHDAGGAVDLLMGAWALAVQRRQLDDATRLAEQARKFAEGDPGREAVAGLAGQAMLALLGASPRPPRGGDAPWADPHLAESLAGSFTRLAGVATGLLALGRYKALGRLLDGVVATGRRRAPGTLGAALAVRSLVSFVLDDWTAAQAAAEEALDLAADGEQRGLVLCSHLSLALVEAGRGQADQCRARLDRAASLIDATQIEVLRPTVSWTLGFLALGQDEPEEALVHLRRAAHLNAGWAGVPPILDDYVDAHAREGLPPAPGVLDVLARRPPSPADRPRAAAIAQRARALLAPDHEIDGRFATALTAAQEGGLRFQAARVELSWGRRLLEADRLPAAAGHLEAARAAFERSGAEPWAAQAAGSLESCRRPAAPTSSTRAGGAGRRPTGPSGAHPAPAAAGERPPAVRVRLLGELTVAVGRKKAMPLPGLAGRLVALLAVRDTPVPVDNVIEQLWPESDPDQSRTRLRKVVWRVRQESPELLVRTGDALALSADVEVDLRAFTVAADDALAAAADGSGGAAQLARAAVAIYRGELLPAFRYDDWAVGPRQAARRRLVALFDLLAVDAAERGDPDAAAGLIDQAVEHDPYDEDRYLRGARLLMQQGRRGPALLLIERAKATMAELGLAASAATTELEAEVRGG